MYIVERPARWKALPSRYAPALLALLALAALPEPTRAQQWQPVPSGSPDAISNMNAGNVGVGTGTASPPAGKLDVRGNILVNGATQVIDVGNKLSLLGDASYPSKAGYMTFRSGDNVVTGYVGALAGVVQPAGAFAGTFSDHKFSLRTNNQERVTISNLGLVGVGTSNPLALFHVDGGGLTGQMRLSGSGAVMSFVDGTSGRRYQWRSEGDIFRMSLLNVNDDNWVRPDILVANSAGYVGLGTHNPAFRLDSAGSVRAVGEPEVQINNQPFFTGGGQQHLWNENVPKFGPSGRGGAYGYGGTGAGTNPGAIFIGGGGVDKTGGAAGVFARGGETVSNNTWNLAWGGVGLFAEGGRNGAANDVWGPAGRYAAAAFFNGYVQVGSNDGRQSGLSVGFDGYNGLGAVLPSGGSLLVSGSVGVGTPAPAFKLDVRGGKVNAEQGLCIAGDCRDSWSQVTGAGHWSQNEGGSLYFNSANVGIGTTSPGASLDIKPAPGAAVAARFQGNIANSNNTQIRFYGSAANTDQWAVGNAVATNDATRNFDIFDLVAGANRLRIDSNGNVGIGAGVTSPTHKLEVEGTIHATGEITGATINATFQDVAEWVPSTQKLQAGTVVVLNPEKANQVISSSEAYDTKVAGVVSERPGIALGEGGEGKVLVATTGRVRVRVDATRAPVRIGDLLVTGEAPGVAMKSEPLLVGGRRIHAPGTIIGKALEPLEKGIGEILVLLSLQ